MKTIAFKTEVKTKLEAKRVVVGFSSDLKIDTLKLPCWLVFVDGRLMATTDQNMYKDAVVIELDSYPKHIPTFGDLVFAADKGVWHLASYDSMDVEKKLFRVITGIAYDGSSVAIFSDAVYLVGNDLLEMRYGGKAFNPIYAIKAEDIPDE